MSVSQVHRQSQSLPGKDLRLRRLVKDLRNGHLRLPALRVTFLLDRLFTSPKRGHSRKRNVKPDHVFRSKDRSRSSF